MFDFISVAASNQWHPLICCCYSVAKSCPTLCRPHALQHAAFPHPSLSPEVCTNSCPLHWCCLITSKFPGYLSGLLTFCIHVMTPIESDGISPVCLGQKEEAVWTWSDWPGSSFPLLIAGHEPNVLTTTIRAVMAHQCRSLPRDVTKSLTHVFVFVLFQ